MKVNRVPFIKNESIVFPTVNWGFGRPLSINKKGVSQRLGVLKASLQNPDGFSPLKNDYFFRGFWRHPQFLGDTPPFSAPESCDEKTSPWWVPSQSRRPHRWSAWFRFETRRWFFWDSTIQRKSDGKKCWWFTIHQGSLVIIQCIIIREIPEAYDRFVLFDSVIPWPLFILGTKWAVFKKPWWHSITVY